MQDRGQAKKVCVGRDMSRRARLDDGLVQVDLSVLVESEAGKRKAQGMPARLMPGNCS